ncbi:MAG: SusC/RagA family TonB-linked outer membrane protein [Bacteroidota bacterium]
MKRLLLSSIVFLFAFTSMTWAQTTVTGTVISAEDDMPLPGVTVQLQGTTRGTTTDVNGKYTIQAPSDGTLMFSYVGFLRQEVEINGRTTIDVALQPDIKQLEDVVVVGYGSQIKEDVTGNIAEVSGEDIERVPVNSIENAIQGRAAGVFVNAGNGKLGQAISVRIRGASSISASSQPLYVIDGVPVISESLSSADDAETNPMASLDLSDIESVTVLKDASATAIYGSRASNGVVLITTKSGVAGDTKFNVTYQTGISEPTNKRDWMNAEQYLSFFEEAAKGSAAYETRLGYWGDQATAEAFWMNNYYTPMVSYLAQGNDLQNPTNYDWQDQAFQDASSRRFTLNASGGGEKTSFFIGGGYSDEEGILIDNSYTKYNGRINVDHKATDKLDLGLRLNVNRTINNRLGNDNLFETPMQMVAQAPISPFYADADPNTAGYQKSEEYNINTYYYNALDITDNSYFETATFHTLGNVFAEYDILSNLSFKTEFGMDVINQNEEYYYNTQLDYYVGAKGSGYNAWTEARNYTSNSYFTYKDTFAESHDLELVLGTSYNWVNQTFTGVQGENFPNDNFTNIANAADITYGSSTDTEYSFLSYFLRANYKLNDKYLIGGSVRVDGSSRFGENNRYGTFPSVSVGWILSEEEFLQDIDAISFMKLRASYGITGNANIDNFPALGLYSGIAYAGNSALVPSQTPNPDLKWETTNQIDVGLDWGLFDDRISGEIDYYIKNTTDLLLGVNVPGTTGFSSQLRNVGELENKGFEFVVNTINSTGDFFWSSSFNIAFNRNKITNLDGQVIEGGYVNRAVEGEAIGVFYAYEFAGANPDNGDAIFYLNREPTQTELNSGSVFEFDGRYVTANPNVAERTVIGDPNPDFIGGFTNKMSWKGFDFDMTWQFVYGNDIYNGGGQYQSASGWYFDNQTTDQLDAWTTPGERTMVPQARLYYGNGTQASSRYLSDGSYLRLKTATLAYNLPADLLNRLNMDKVRLFVTGSNLITFTDYDGWDPEVSTDYLGSNIALGNDFYAAPQPRSVSVGINIGF